MWRPPAHSQGYSPIDGGGVQRTDMNCHACSKSFVAELDLDLDGEYVIECPHCGHEHYRRVAKGAITERRWGSDSSTSPSEALKRPRSVWKSSVIKAQTSTVAHFLRERWLQRSDLNV